MFVESDLNLRFIVVLNVIKYWYYSLTSIIKTSEMNFTDKMID
jgi:hypothetical protein